VIFSQFRLNSKQILELDSPTLAYIYYRDRRFNILTGFPELYSIDQFCKNLEKIKLDTNFDSPRVYHFYYEFGFIAQGFSHLIDNEMPLVIEIEYRRQKKIKTPKSPLDRIDLKSLERPTWSEYKESFHLIQEHLRAGNCYQLNLTYPFDFYTEENFHPKDLSDYFFSQKNLGAYAHTTYLGQEMILSNSPECLFQYKKNEIFTMPIKGTKKYQGKNWKQIWHELINDPKESGELIMITDLLKNDLNRLEKPRAEVIKLKAPLIAPGLIHQYSLIALKLESSLNLLKVMESLFPGGSITGAPKKKVMELTSSIERYQRRLYCGSTLLCRGKLKAASINIRTAQIDLDSRVWRYGAGGGITLLSKAPQEFQEMELKVESFLALFK
jgi:para-aminobenzoate synthetase component 1